MLNKLMEVLISEYSTRAILDNLADCLANRSVFLSDDEARRRCTEELMVINQARGLMVSGLVDSKLALITAAIKVARLNYDHPDNIRPQTYGAQEAFHALEDAAQGYLGEKWRCEEIE